MLSILEQAISKYGGTDLAYKNKLKSTIREQLGYNNYMVKLGQETGAPAPIGDIKGLSPAGINARIASRFGSQDERINTNVAIAGAFDTAAGTIASDQIAAAKAAAAAKENMQFTPTNWVESEIVSYLKNPYNQDGTLKTKQQLTTQLKGAMLGEDDVMNKGIDEAFIDRRISEWIPEDFESKPKEYQYRTMGYTKAQTQDLMNFDRYSNGQMGGAEKSVFEIANPSWVAKAEEIKASKGLLEDIKNETDPNTGETKPKFTFDELRQKYPNVSEPTLKELVKPVEQQSMQDDIKQWYSGKVKKGVDELLSTPLEKGGGQIGLESSKTFKELQTKLEREYAGVFTAGEIATIIYNTIRSTQ